MTSITSACTCSVDGVSGSADTRYKGYSFTGCGAHVEYKYSLFDGAGYERTWCYVTSPDDCPGEDPYIPEGFKDDNTLPEWKEAGAAWKECYDGYRCEAWWGSLDGQHQGDPVMLKAPLDWPDCCAWCSDTNVNSTNTTTAACAGWSFRPATGSCQLMSDLSLEYNVSTSWGVNGTVSGYPGYFEAPVTGCWSRGSYDLCDNMNLGLLIPGVILAFFGLGCVCRYGIIAPLENSSLLRAFLRDRHSNRLQKAACVEVSSRRVISSTGGKGGPTYVDVCKGTFVTRDGSLFVVPSRTGGNVVPPRSRKIEQKMMRILISTWPTPLADPAVAARCRTPKGLRSEFSSLLHSKRRHATGTVRRPEGEDRCPRFDCLLLVGGHGSGSHWRPEREVLLVGILGEDRITCIDGEILGFSFCKRSTGVGICFVSIAIVLLVILCMTLLNNEAAQVMAVWTFPGTDYRTGAVVGLVLCGSIPVAFLVWRMCNKAAIMRLVDQFPPAADEQSTRAPSAPGI